MTNNRTIALFFLSALVTHVHSAQHNNQPTPQKDIWEAIETGDVDHVKAAIPIFLDPVDCISFQFNAKRSEDGNTPLHTAVERGQLATVKLFLTRKLFMEMKNDAEKTPLHLAAKHGHVAIAQELLTHGANPNEKDSGGDTALHTAAENGRPKVVQLLLNNGAQANVPSEDNMTALHIAATYGDVKIMQLLLTRQANPHATDENGETPLHKAAKGGHVDAARLLIEKYKEGIHKVDSRGKTPLHMAIENGHMEVIRLLIEYGARVNSVDNDGWTPLHLAANNDHIEVIRLLIKYGARVNSVDNDDKTPLHNAAGKGKVTTAQLLLDEGADLLANTNQLFGEWTPLMLAVQGGRALMTQFLIRQGRARGHGLNTLLGDSTSLALHLAIEQALDFNKDGDATPDQKNSSQRGENLILYLLEAGGNPDNQHEDIGMLHLAAEYDKGKVARMLLDHGANPNSEDTSGYGNSIYLASQSNYRNMMRLLVARGAKPIQTVPANPQEAQFQTELAQIGHNRRQMFRRILRSKGLPFDLIGHMAQFAPFDIARQ